jgi:hypothetical protein
MATTTTNFGWDIPQSTDLVKDGATAIAALGQDIDTAMVDLKGGTTGQVLAKASGTDLDFSWVAQDDSNAIQNAIVDAKGDLIAASAADTPARLAVGTNGQVLTADSAESTGLKWATATSGGMTLLSTTNLTTTTTTISSIDQSYVNLYIEISGINWGSSGQQMNLQYNGVTSGYYGAANADYTTSVIRLDNGSNIFVAAGSAHGTTGDSICSVLIPSYAVASRRHTLTFQHNYVDSSSTARVVFGTSGNGNTSAVSSFTVISSVTPTAGTVKIYGVK